MAAIVSRHVHFLSSPVSHVKYFPPASRYQDDLVTNIQRITNRNNGLIHVEADDDDDDDLPPIEKVLNPGGHDTVSILDCNIGCGSQNPERRATDTNENRIGSKQLKLDNTRDSPVILEDDDPDTFNYRVTDISVDEPGQQISLSTEDVWYDVEDNRYVDGNGRPIPQFQLDGLTSASIPSQNSHCSRDRSPQLSQEQINPDGNDKTIPSISDDQMPESSCAHVRRGEELERDMLLAFEELEKSSSATLEPSRLQPDQEQGQSSSVDKTIDECGQHSAFNNCHQEAEQEQEQHQRQEEFFKAAGTEDHIHEYLISVGEVIFHMDPADQHKEAVDHDPHHTRELQLRSESTADQPVPASEIQAQCFRIRGIRTSKSTDRQSETTQYHVVWGRHPNKRSSWVKDGDIQLYMLMQPETRDFEDLLSSLNPSSQAQHEIDVRHFITPIEDSYCDSLQNSQSLSGSSASSSSPPGRELQPRNLAKKRRRPGSGEETGSNSHHPINTEDSHDLCDVSSDEESRPPKRRKQRSKSVAASQSRRSPQHNQGPATTAVQRCRGRTTAKLVDNSPTPLFGPISRDSSPSSESEATAADLDREWEIRGIVNQKAVDGEDYFLVNWEPTWMPASELDGARELVDEFLAGFQPSRRKSSNKTHIERACLEWRQQKLRSDRSGKTEPSKRRGRPRKPINPLDVGSNMRPFHIGATTSELQIEDMPWTVEEDMMVVQLKENGYSWAEIQKTMTHRNEDEIHERYSTKLKRMRHETLRRRAQRHELHK
ncbi:hypothetical protein B7463_g12280, partial [Scytalidium lignicola]